jgi:hypothetical protein
MIGHRVQRVLPLRRAVARTVAQSLPPPGEFGIRCLESACVDYYRAFLRLTEAEIP